MDKKKLWLKTTAKDCEKKIINAFSGDNEIIPSRRNFPGVTQWMGKHLPAPLDIALRVGM